MRLWGMELGGAAGAVSGVKWSPREVHASREGSAGTVGASLSAREWRARNGACASEEDRAGSMLAMFWRWRYSRHGWWTC